MMMPPNAKTQQTSQLRLAYSLLFSLFSALLFFYSSSAFSQDRPAAHEGWIAGSGVLLQTLDKITARIATAEAKLGQSLTFGTLQIVAHHCAYRPPEAPPETAAFLQINDVGYNLSDATTQSTVFSGWMFASSPAISSLEHPVYDVTVLACTK